MPWNTATWVSQKTASIMIKRNSTKYLCVFFVNAVTQEQRQDICKLWTLEARHCVCLARSPAWNTRAGQADSAVPAAWRSCSCAPAEATPAPACLRRSKVCVRAVASMHASCICVYETRHIHTAKRYWTTHGWHSCLSNRWVWNTCMSNTKSRVGQLLVYTSYLQTGKMVAETLWAQTMGK